MRTVCPNYSSPEWTRLVSKVSEWEAHRDWLENDYTIRTPEEVLRKLAKDNNPSAKSPVYYSVTEGDKYKKFQNLYTKVVINAAGFTNDKSVIKEGLKQGLNLKINKTKKGNYSVVDRDTGEWVTESYVNSFKSSPVESVKKKIEAELPSAVAKSITVLKDVPQDILGRADLFLSLKELLNDNGINDELLINWAGVNKDGLGHPKNIKSEAQLTSIIQKRLSDKQKESNYNEFKSNPLALESFRKWVKALEKYPVAFQEVMLTHAIKWLTNPVRRSKYVLQLSDVALTAAYGIVVNKPHELNRIGKLYDQEVLNAVSDAVGHERAASGNGFWVTIPRVESSAYLGYDTYDALVTGTMREIDDLKTGIARFKERLQPEYHTSLVKQLEELQNQTPVFKKQETSLDREDANKYGFQDYDFVRTESTYSRDRRPYDTSAPLWEKHFGKDFEGYYIHGYNTAHGKPDTKVIPITKEQAEELWKKDIAINPIFGFDVQDQQEIYRLQSKIKNWDPGAIEESLKDNERRLKKIELQLKTADKEEWAKHDTRNQFKVNVELLRKLSPSTWCTVGEEMASNKVRQYDNYILIVNGATVTGIEASPVKDIYKYELKPISKEKYDKAFEKSYAQSNNVIGEFTEDGTTYYVDVSETERYRRDNTGYYEEIATKDLEAMQKQVREVSDATSYANNGTASIDHLDDILAFFAKHNLDTNTDSIQSAIAWREKGKTDKDFPTERDFDVEGEVGPINVYGDGYDNDGYPGDPPEYDYNDYMEEQARELENAAIREVVGRINTLPEAMAYFDNNRYAFEFFTALPQNLKDNEVLARRAVESNSSAIVYISPTVPFYEELVRKSIIRWAGVFNHLPEEAQHIFGLRELYETERVRQQDDLPFSKTNSKLIQGYYDPKTDKVVVIAANTPLDQASKVGIHEVAHRGMLRMAKELGGLKELNKALSAAEPQLMKKLPELLKRTGHKNLESLMKDYGFTTTSEEGKIKLLMELSARWAETLVGKPKPVWWKALIQNIKKWITKFTGIVLNEDEVNELVGGFVQYGTDKSVSKEVQNIIMKPGNQYEYAGEMYPTYEDALNAKEDNEGEDPTKSRNGVSYYREVENLYATPEITPVTEPANEDANKAINIIDSLVNSLNRKIPGVNAQNITSEQAPVITQNAPNAWKGEAGFNYKGKIYFVRGRVNTTMVFHEFSHPIVKALSLSNPVLFRSLYDTIAATHEGHLLIESVKKEYKDYLQPDTDSFKEEIIVHAMASKANAIRNKQEQTKEFGSILSKIMFHIKQLLRKLFTAKIDVSKLDVTTTLDQLADMLVNDEFTLPSEEISQEDIVKYVRKVNEYAGEIIGQKMEDKVQALLQRIYDITGMPEVRAMNNENYPEMLNLLKNEFGYDQLTLMRGDINAYRSIILQRIKDKIAKGKATANDLVSTTDNQVKTFVNALYQLDVIISNMAKETLNIRNAVRTPADVARLDRITDFIKYWETFLNDKTEGVKTIFRHTPGILGLADKILNDIHNIQADASPVYKEGTTALLNEILAPARKMVDDYYVPLIANAKKARYSKWVIDDYEKEYARLKLNPERISNMLSGLGDANIYNHILEGWMYNSDPIVGGMGIFFKNTLNDIHTATQQRFTDFVYQVTKLAKEAGFDLGKSDFTELAKKLTFTDTKVIMENGSPKDMLVYTFLNLYKEYRAPRAHLAYNIQEAEEALRRDDTPENEAILDDLRKKQDEESKYFWSEYTSAVDDRNRIFDNPLGREVKAKLNKIYDKINQLEKSIDKEGDFTEIAETIDLERKKISKMASKLDDNGVLKTNTKDLETATMLQEYFKAGKDLYEEKELKPGLFQEKLSRYYQELIDERMDPNSQEFDDKVKEWIKFNTVRALKKDYYVKLREALDMLKTDEEDSDPIEIALRQAYRERIDIISGFRDKNNQPVGTEMSKETLEKLHAVEERIIDLRKKDKTGLTSSEQAKLEDYFEIMNSPDPAQRQLSTNPADEYNQMDFDELIAARDTRNNIDPNSPEGIRRINKLIRINTAMAKMKSLSGKEATEYYIDTFNEFLSRAGLVNMVTKGLRTVPESVSPEELKKLGINPIADVNNKGYMEKSSAKYIANLSELQKILDTKGNERFKQWFEINHIKRTWFDRKSGQHVTEWERISAWSVPEPKDRAMYETTMIPNPDGTVTPIIGKPSSRFYSRKIKDQYRTGYNPVTKKVELKVGYHIDVFGNWLPKSQKDGAPTDKYINQDYVRLRDAASDSTDGKLFTLLEKVKELFINSQEGADNYAKLYYDFPRERVETAERIAAGETGDVVSTWWTNLKAMFKKKAADNAEMGQNVTAEDIQEQMVLNNEILFKKIPGQRRIPVNGIYNLDQKEVSLDMFHSMAQYMGGTERQRQLKKILPYFKATQKVLEDDSNAVRDIKDLDERMWDSQFLTRPVVEKKLTSRGGKNERAKALGNKIEREFYGQKNAGMFNDNKQINAIVNYAFRGASMSFLALQFPSAIANMTVQVVQNIIRGVAGEDFSLSDLAKGSVFASEMSVALSNEIHEKGEHGLMVQLMEIMDPIPGAGQKNLGRSQGRSFLRDFASMSWLYSPRKFMENFATLQAFGAMMHRIKITQNTPEGPREINYLEAWTLKDGKITLKDGIDPKYGIGGEVFNYTINFIQQVQYDMNGAYDDFAQPEAARYMLYRLYAFLRKYVTTMITNRFAPMRFSPGRQSVTGGFYRETYQLVKRGVHDPKVFKNMSKKERASVLQFAAELGMVALMYFMYGLFGWDPDDPDKYEKLRAKSGPLPLPFITDTGDPFELGGWLSNHSLLQLLKLKGQTEMWIPLPGLGLKDYTDLMSIAPIAFGPTLTQGAKMFNNLSQFATGNDNAYYKKEIGPFDWQQADQLKMWNYLGQLAGIRGLLADPVSGVLKNQQATVLK